MTAAADPASAGFPVPDVDVVTVELSDRSYPLYIGSGVLAQAGPCLRSLPAFRNTAHPRAAVICDTRICDPYGDTVVQSLRDADVEVTVIEVPSGETSKSIAQLNQLYDALADFPADRRTAVVAVGGGVTGDLAGFAAATFNRGLPFIQVPTTLLAQVDSSVGGKTGINHPRGKNLIGAFHQPQGVLLDPEVFDSLSDRDYRSGLAEVIKYGVILDAPFFEVLENNLDNLNKRDTGILKTAVRRSCELKAEVVREDEFETTGLRAILNYGHTFAHAFEALAGYGTLTHGEAVSVGMVCAADLARRLNRIDADFCHRQTELLKSVGLPVTVPADVAAQPEAILDCMRRDKKSVNRRLRFILPDRLGHVETVPDVAEEEVIRTIAACSA